MLFCHAAQPSTTLQTLQDNLPLQVILKKKKKEKIKSKRKEKKKHKALKSSQNISLYKQLEFLLNDTADYLIKNLFFS